MKKIPVFLLLLITAGSITAQVNVNDALSRMDSAISSSQDEFTMRDSYFLGRTVAAHILSRYELYTERPELTNYLNLICRALAINSPAPNWYDGYTVAILDNPAFNAFSTPGGHIFITRGFIDVITSEDMLAAVIAHELAHIQLEHGTAGIMNTRIIQRLGQEQQRLSQELSGSARQQLFTEMVDEIVQSLFGGGYSQLQEFEADLMALNLLALAGYNPGGLIELLRMFERLRENQMGSLNATHPLPAQRIANLERQMNMYNSMPNNSSVRRERFNTIIERR